MRVLLLLALAMPVWTGCRDPQVLPTDATVSFRDRVAEVVTRKDGVELDGAGLDADVATHLDAAADRVADATAEAGDGVAPDGAPEAGLSPAVIPERRVTCGTAPPAAEVTAGAVDRYVVRGRVVTPTMVLAPGEVLVTGRTVACVAASCASHAAYAGATVIATGGIIYPGLVNVHDHPEYDFLPPWTPPRLYLNQGGWSSSPEYAVVVRAQRNFSRTYECQMSKWGEIRSLVAGATSIQGAPDRNCLKGTLARNLEYATDFERVDTHRTNTLGIGSVSDADARSLRAAMDAGRVTAYLIHLAEGVNDTSRREFERLVAQNLLTSATVVIHGTALAAADFAQMAAARARLVWSPRSNVVLYGRTTDVAAALEAGVPVALGPDWTLSGSPNVLAELRYARYVSRTALGGRLSSRDLVEMVTSRAAAVVDRPQVGSLAEGRYADLLVVPDRGCDPYDTLIDTPTADVRLVMVDGRPLYGDATLFEALPAAARPRCEAVTFCGNAKQLCVALASTADSLGQTYADIETALRSFADPYPVVPLCP